MDNIVNVVKDYVFYVEYVDFTMPTESIDCRIANCPLNEGKIISILH